MFKGYTCDRCGKYFYAVKQREHHVANAERLCSKKVLLTPLPVKGRREREKNA